MKPLETLTNIDKIAIFCNTQFSDLYEHSLSFYKDLPFKKIQVPGQNKFYSLNFMLHVIEKFKDYDWGIFIDEDCFISDTDAMLDLLEYQISNNYSFSGPPDGGVITHRFHNPVSINTFFTIINLKEIRENYNNSSILSSKYDRDLDKHIPHEMLKEGLNLKYDNYEPYYKLFFWMLRNGAKPLYLNVRNYNKKGDNLTSVLRNHNNVEFAYHSWFSRNWERGQRNRIENVISDAKNKI